jgi:hypothetical protein
MERRGYKRATENGMYNNNISIIHNGAVYILMQKPVVLNACRTAGKVLAEQ